MDLSGAGADVLFVIFAHLDAIDVWRARLVSKAWCSVSEASFTDRCRAKKWCLPRKPRGVSAKCMFPHRTLFKQNACARCVDGPGGFRVSKDIGRQHIRQFSLCAVCLSNVDCVERLQGWGLLIDFQSNEGKILPGLKRKKGTKKTRASARAFASGEAIDQGIQGFV